MAVGNHPFTQRLVGEYAGDGIGQALGIIGIDIEARGSAGFLQTGACAADGRAYAQRFDAEQLTMQMLQLYSSVL